MLRPFLLVGVGGSGGKTLRVIREDLQRRLAQAGWTGDIPQAWQFLHVDVPTHADGNDRDLPAQLPARDYQGLVASGLDYRTIDSALLQVPGERLRDAVSTWRPDPNKVNVPASKGAGQYRTLGRIIAVAGLERISEALNRARRALTGAEVAGELADVSRLLGGTSAPTAADPTVIVISSIAGGSGAGAVIDVCDAIRSFADKWADESVGFLYAPDVFDYLPEEARRGVRPNSLATLAELLNGYWNSLGPSDATTELFARYGVTLGGTDKRSGPRYPFLVGAQNSSVTYKTQNDIYRAMGRSIASWVASAALQDSFTAFLQGNWASAAASVPDRLPIHRAGTETPFSAIGSARVGLGRDRFADYASEHLARTVVDRITREHEKRRGHDDDRTEKQLVRDTADEVFRGFLSRSRLDERGEDRNDVIDALRPPTQKEEGLSLVAQITDRIRSEMSPKGEKHARVHSLIVSAVRDRSSEFLTSVRQARYSVGREWVTEIQDHLVSETARQVAVSGAAVTEQVLHKLVSELHFVRDELQQEAARYKRWGEDLATPVAQQLGDPDGGLITPSAEAVSVAVKKGVATLMYQAEAELREIAAALLPDLLTGFVEPLATAVRYAHERLAHERDQAGSPVSTWPEGDVIPVRLRPAPNEFLLDSPDDYPVILERLVQRTTGSADPRDARSDAELQVMLGTDELEGTDQQLIRRTTSWVPRDHNLAPSSTAVPTRAAFALASGQEQLVERASHWLTKEGTAVGSYMAQGLRDYLDPGKSTPTEHADRLRRFENQLGAALQAAEPLVSINPAVLVQVHGQNSVRHLNKFGEIPLPDKSPARDVFRRVLESRGQWSDDIEKSYTDGAGGFIDVFTHLGAPYEPVVFDSLMRPIASDWGAKNKAPDSRAEFWRWRRARPLNEFLPMSPEVLDAMIRGWFVAGTLKHIYLDEGSAAVFVPSRTGSGGDFLPFPSPTLRNLAINGPEGLAVVLESIVLALVEVNSQESLQPIQPYDRLVTLGGAGGVAGDEETFSVELKRWIVSGENRRPDAEPAHGDAESRKTFVLDRLDALRTTYENHFLEVGRRSEALEFPPTYDLRHQILAAIGDLHRAVEALDAAPAGKSVWV
ncbi:tubulin-like doman-containing protein [Isoptericola sp. b515]|uniref:tubulin-like doman-containing protein n=1 Tax=Isoptericola sp. b515 TaxID=3064652 RepID=UPI00271358C9|nr:tubulin-like doman-containing protein [Isoptericola sp. b515]MDO8147521.1 tubulin-like doman-containing protein [Isoptericola sp. b515]